MKTAEFNSDSGSDLTAHQARSRFLAAWVRGERPALDDFLQAGAVGPLALLDMVQVDLLFRLKEGENARVEQYLERFPELREDEAAVVALIATEFELAGNGTTRQHSLGDYLKRFPEYSAALREQFPPPPAAESGLTAMLTPPPPGTATERRPARATLTARPVGDGQTIGTYQVLGELGRGGMGVVYKARHSTLNRIVALKMILSGEHASPRELARFTTEAEAIARLHHPNIVQIYEIGEHEGRPFLTLEYVDGGSLAQQLDGKPIPTAQAARILETLARAVHYAHQQGIIHRDLKPVNVLLANPQTRLSGVRADAQSTLTDEPAGSSAAGPAPGMNLGRWSPKITDFGLAKQLDNDATQQTRSGVIVGTPAYMAPEQAKGENRDVSPATDVYALGVLLFEMLTGRPPFLGQDALDTLLQVTRDEPVPPSRLQPKVPRDLETICLKCLQKAPRQRYESAEELADDVHRFLAGEPIRARRVGLAERTVKWIRRRPGAAALWGGGVAVTLVLLIGALVYLRQAQQHLEKARGEVRDLVVRAQEAANNEAWENARERVAAADARIASDPALADLGGDPQLQRLRGRLTARTTYLQFVQQRDDAIFQATLSFGEGSRKNVQLTRDKALKALTLLGLEPATAVAWRLSDSFSDAEKAALRDSSYELLLVLAEAVAQPLSGQTADEQRDNARQALRLLDAAHQLGVRTHAYHLRRARYLTQSGNAVAAKAELRRAQERAPLTGVDNYLLGVELYKRGEPAEALPRLRASMRLDAQQFWARYFLALCYVQLDQPALARDNLTACLGQRPGIVWIYLMRGFVEGQLGSHAAAEADFARALDLLQREPSPDAEYVLYNNRGVIHMGQRNFAAAIADFRAAVKLKPQQYQAYVSLSQVYAQQKDLDEALTQLNEAIAVAAPQVESRNLEPSTLALLYRQRSQLNADRQHYDEALRDLDQAISLEPAGTAALGRLYLERGRLLQQRQRYADALAAYDAALKLAPTRAEIQRRRGEVLYQLERYADVVAAFDRYFELGGKPTVRSYQLRASARSRLGDHQRAVGDLSLALGLEPAQEELLLARGQAYLACQAYALALQDFDEAVRRNPESGPAYNGRGYARVKLEHTKDAATDADKAVRLGPITPQLLYGAARTFAQAAGALENDADRQRQQLRLHYQERALELVERALNEQPAGQRLDFWRGTVARDGALAPIRRASGYTRLAARFAGTEK